MMATNIGMKDVYLEHQAGQIARVYCSYCHQAIGRLQTLPTTEAADQEQIWAEVRLIADEHRPICPERPSDED